MKTNLRKSSEKSINFLNIKKMDKVDLDLLDQIYITSIMAIQAIETIQTKIKGKALRQELKSEYMAYRNIYSQSVEILLNQGKEAGKINFLTRSMKKTMIKFEIMLDDSDSHIADMMIKGTNMGIVEVYKKINDCTLPENNSLKNLANKLLNTLRNNVDKLAKFL